MAEQEGSQSSVLKLTVEDHDSDQRLDIFISKNVPELSRSRVKQLVDQELITCNAKICKASHKVMRGDLVEIDMRVRKPVAPANILMPDLAILYQDEDIVVINKPVGVIVHRGAGETGITLVDMLIRHVGKLSQIDPSRPGIVHRLDKDTSGVMICAKNDVAHQALAKQFEEKSNFREYVALLDGYMAEAQLSVESMIGRDPSHRQRMKSMTLAAHGRSAEDNVGLVRGKWARTHFRKLKSYRHRLTFAAAQLETGRTHQVRVHARDLKMPVVGDSTYHRAVELPKTFDPEVRKQISEIPRQLLHARYLGVTHPRTQQKMAFEAPIPPDFARILEILKVYEDES